MVPGQSLSVRLDESQGRETGVVIGTSSLARDRRLTRDAVEEVAGGSVVGTGLDCPRGSVPRFNKCRVRKGMGIRLIGADGLAGGGRRTRHCSKNVNADPKGTHLRPRTR